MTPILAPRPRPTAASFRRRRIPLVVVGLAFAAAGLWGAPAAVATPSVDAANAIDAKYTSFGGAGSLLGTPIAAAVDVGDGAERDYSGGVIYYSKDTGAKVMYGAILDRYKSLGGPMGDLGFPTNDESDAGNGVARFNDFTAPGGASIYWSPQWGAMVVKGRVRDAWLASGGVNGPFSYPTTDTATTTDVQTGKFVGPAGTEIQWSNAAGLVTVPAGLASSLPGFLATAPSVEGTQSVTAPPVATPTLNAPTNSAPNPVHSGFNKLWWIPITLALVAAIGGLMWLFGRRRGSTADVQSPRPTAPVAPVPPARASVAEPAKLTSKPEIKPTPTKSAPTPAAKAAAPAVPKVTQSPNGAGDAAKAPTAPAPPPKAAPAPPKPAVASAPVRKAEPSVPTPPPPRAAPVSPPPAVPSPPPVTTPVLRAVSDVAKEAVPAAVVREVTGAETSPAIKYETPDAAASTKIEITYENNAIGDGQESTADKSSHHRQT